MPIDLTAKITFGVIAARLTGTGGMALVAQLVRFLGLAEVLVRWARGNQAAAQDSECAGTRCNAKPRSSSDPRFETARGELPAVHARI